MNRGTTIGLAFGLSGFIAGAALMSMIALVKTPPAKESFIIAEPAAEENPEQAAEEEHADDEEPKGPLARRLAARRAKRRAQKSSGKSLGQSLAERLRGIPAEASDA